MLILDRLKSLVAGPAAGDGVRDFRGGDRGGAHRRAERSWSFSRSRAGTLAVSPLKENVVDPDDFALAVRALAGTQAARKRKDVALILPDFSARIAVLDFDSFPSDAKEQLALIRFRLKRSVPFDVESAAVSYWAQPAADKNVDVVVVMAPLEIVARYEAPFRAAGMNPGLVTTSSLAALELAPESGLSVMAKLSGRVLTVLVRDKGALKLARCLELPSTELEDVAAVLVPTFVYVEDNLGGRAGEADAVRVRRAHGRGRAAVRGGAGRGGGAVAVAAGRRPGENNAGLLGYLRSIARNN